MARALVAAGLAFASIFRGPPASRVAVPMTKPAGASTQAEARPVMAQGPERPTNFALIIGAMKSGTTSLFELLSQHPEIAGARVKEPNYFADEEAWSKGWDWYVGLWDWQPGRHRIALEASPAYTTFPARPGVPARIAGVRDARFRFIYVMRHPAEQISSNVRHTLYAGWGQSLDEGISSWMIDTVRYAMQIDEYAALFPRESLLLVTLEEFRDQPEQVLRRICAFLGVSKDFAFANTDERYNAGDLYEMPAFIARVVKAEPLRALASRVLPRSWHHRIRAMLPRVTGRKAPLGRHRLTEEERNALLAELAPDLRRLETVYGVDVQKQWFTGTSGSRDAGGAIASGRASDDDGA